MDDLIPRTDPHGLECEHEGIRTGCNPDRMGDGVHGSQRGLEIGNDRPADVSPPLQDTQHGRLRRRCCHCIPLPDVDEAYGPRALGHFTSRRWKTNTATHRTAAL